MSYVLVPARSPRLALPSEGGSSWAVRPPSSSPGICDPSPSDPHHFRVIFAHPEVACQLVNSSLLYKARAPRIVKPG